jgi:hypothetical protein
LLEPTPIGAAQFIRWSQGGYAQGANRKSHGGA